MTMSRRTSDSFTRDGTCLGLLTARAMRRASFGNGGAGSGERRQEPTLGARELTTSLPILVREGPGSIEDFE